MPAVIAEFEIDEKETGTYRGTVVGNDGVTPIPAASLATMVLTLFTVLADGSTTIINGRNHQNVLNANNVTIDANGLLTWAIQVADTTLVTSTLPFERHQALFEFTTVAGAAGKHPITIVVRNLEQAA